MNNYGYNRNDRSLNSRQNFSSRDPQMGSNINNQISYKIPDFIKNNKINPDLFSNVAEELANKIKKEGLDNNGNLKKNKSTQIRKFYDELLRIKNLIKKPDDYENYKPYIVMVKSRVAYSKGRDLVTKVVYDFISDGIAKSTDYKNFEIFMNFFESVIAYYKMINPNDK